jgi:hypothetical protein
LLLQQRDLLILPADCACDAASAPASPSAAVESVMLVMTSKGFVIALMRRKRGTLHNKRLI